MDTAVALLARGRANASAGHAVRMVAFGSAAGADEARRWHAVPMAHVVAFLAGAPIEWDLLSGAQVTLNTRQLVRLAAGFIPGTVRRT